MRTISLNDDQHVVLTGLLDSVMETGPADDSPQELDYQQQLAGIRAALGPEIGTAS